MFPLSFPLLVALLAPTPSAAGNGRALAVLPGGLVRDGVPNGVLTAASRLGRPRPQDGPQVSQQPAWDLDRLRSTAEQIRSEIEELRGLAFKQPVRIELADRDTFLEYTRARLEANAGREEIELDGEVAVLLGLIPGDEDLYELTMKVLMEQVGGFYDPHTATFYIMDSVQPELARVIMAHEFTHALDDQHHDLDGTAEALAGNSDALLAHSAVVEGSGMELMLQWAAQHLTPSQLAEMVQAQAELPTDAVAGAAPFVWKPLVAIYYQGQHFMRHQARIRPLSGFARMSDVDRALSDPPRSTEQVLHPVKYWSPEHVDEPRQVSIQVGHLPQGWSVAREDTFGELYAALLTTPFADRGGMNVSLVGLISLRFTNEAATGWGGDRYVLLHKGEGVLLHMSTRWDSIKDAQEFALALQGLQSGIEASKARGQDTRAETRGLRVEHAGGDEVVITSWIGLGAQEVQTALDAITFSERDI
ncbi:MAG: hypothetical protein V3T22_02840 [Planctomycetota bacterium]